MKEKNEWTTLDNVLIQMLEAGDTKSEAFESAVLFYGKGKAIELCKMVLIRRFERGDVKSAEFQAIVMFYGKTKARELYKKWRDDKKRGAS